MSIITKKKKEKKNGILYIPNKLKKEKFNCKRIPEHSEYYNIKKGCVRKK